MSKKNKGSAKKRQPAPAFQLYPRDVLADPAFIVMSHEERGGYFALMLHAWNPLNTKPGHLPNDPKMLAALAGMTPDVWQRCSPGILAAFTVTEETICLEWMAAYHLELAAYRKKQSEAGARGNDVRWGKDQTGAQGGGQTGGGSAPDQLSQPDRNPIALSSVVLRLPSVELATATTSTEDCAAGASPPAGTGGLDLDADEGPKKPKAKKADPLPYTVDQLQAALTETCNRYTPTEPNKGQTINAQKLIKKYTLDQVRLAGEWLQAGGEGWKATLDARALGDLGAWIAHAEKWSATGRTPIGKGKPNGHRGTAPVDDWTNVKGGIQ